MNKNVFMAVIVLAASLFWCGNAVSSEKSDNLPVRVCIADDKTSVSLAVRGDYKVYEINSDRVLMQNPYLSAVVTATKDGISIGDKELGRLADQPMG